MKIHQYFKALREPTSGDHMPSIDAFMYLEYCMTAVGWIEPTKESSYLNSRLYKLVRIVVFIFAFYIGVGFLIT